MSTSISLKNRLESLSEKHRQLDKEIQVQYKNFASDSIVEKLKVQKLRLKDEMSRLKRKLKESM